MLHDVLAVPFREVGRIIGRSGDAPKMHASRARRKVRDAPRPAEDPPRQRGAVDAFLAAAREGDFEALLRLPHPDVPWRTGSPHGVAVRLGATEVAA